MTEPVANKTRKRTIENWETVSVTPLPIGWANAYEMTGEDEGTTMYVPCPALLLQELRSVTHCTDWLAEDGSRNWTTTSDENLAPPYSTRVEPADFSDMGVRAASDTSNYLCTLFRPHFFQEV
ncbi:hypothetical protein [Rhodococcus sp. LW-XY12]|uniref:hypothetical protein n=1 Tax=Rhodococcus sp. LW-XY12 TaxID=2856851 RepID=UPI001C592EF9|nr:hypothetical protein [Rhodococcus sp. LW-XY12]QXU55222.1 hypothetical protein KXC42_08365 [Rhodococcus sp. LW-XY12]